MRINFGVSPYSRDVPGVPWKERIMTVPDEGPLPPMCPNISRWFPRENAEPRRQTITDYQNGARRGKGPSRELHAVCFDMNLSHSNWTFVMYLIWISERNEWVAFEHNESPEGHSTD
jgi:hypothetical protein